MPRKIDCHRQNVTIAANGWIGSTMITDTVADGSGRKVACAVTEKENARLKR